MAGWTCTRKKTILEGKSAEFAAEAMDRRRVICGRLLLAGLRFGLGRGFARLNHLEGK
jgi:hypothetical protein